VSSVQAARYGEGEKAEMSEQQDWQGTEEEATAILKRTNKIAEAAWQGYQAEMTRIDGWKKWTADIKPGEWVTEITSMMFRSEPSVWRVGKVIAMEPSYEGSTRDFDYQIETLHGQRINWRNCKMIRVFDLFEEMAVIQ
jgi:hypothetical protein